MHPEDCFAKAKSEKLAYVGLQFGGECWGGSSFGRYGKKDDKECNMICTEDPELYCGSGWRNSVYFVTHYEGEDEDPDKCPDLPPRDCSKDGGLDKSDKCQQTCMNDAVKLRCQADCFQASQE